MKIMTTKRDLRTWVDTVTSGWDVRTDEDVDCLTDSIQADEHPAWGDDWAEFLDALPELHVMLDEIEAAEAAE